MNNALRDLLATRGADVAAILGERLRASRADSYKRAEDELLAARCLRLVDTLIESLGAAPERFVGYVRGIAEERIAEGYQIAEIQTALTILETELWSIVARQDWDRERTLRELTGLTGVIGGAKDQLARVYVEQLARASDRVAHLEARLEELFKGTDTMALQDDAAS